MAMNLDKLFLDTLKDIYYAERQILKALNKQARAAQHPELKEAFTLHREQTQTQIERLQQVFEILGKRAQGITCEAMNGILEEASELLEEEPEASPVRDAGLLAAAQCVEHYEIARYGTLIAWANAAGKQEITDLLKQNLEEEKQTDELLTRLAETMVNPEAAKAA
ncbi:YciE/YciF ferroxidase family protein [Sabulicella rubraurantiaca]|uniref:YciE/YciF ferroxidase family protein n=1 Tax=Sabulicella rubraurantiaca TaxID=2811429 RepID=UPI001A97879E|nr:ferritin-like domain-containing protein [Sabulicella rubraurantiaca]